MLFKACCIACLLKQQDRGEALPDMSDFQLKPNQSDTFSYHEMFENTDISIPEHISISIVCLLASWHQHLVKSTRVCRQRDSAIVLF